MTRASHAGTAGPDPLAQVPQADPRDPLARLRWAMEQAERMAARQAESDARSAARTAEAARRGDLGEQWQRVQRRVDRGETTVADVFSGRDASPDAVALAGRSRAQMGELLGSVPAADEASLAEAFDALAQIRERVAAALGEVAGGGAAGSARAGGSADGRPSWLEQR